MRRYIGKRAALAETYGRPWQDVALEWDAKRWLTQSQIAEEWTKAAEASQTDARFSRSDVNNIIFRARNERAEAAA